jgi:hypothetical protein
MGVNSIALSATTAAASTTVAVAIAIATTFLEEAAVGGIGSH